VRRQSTSTISCPADHRVAHRRQGPALHRRGHLAGLRRQQGVIAIERSRYVALTGDRTASNVALWLAPDVDGAALEATLRRAVPGGERLEIARPAEIRDASLKVFDRTFAVTYALELVAVVIGLVGLSSSFGALVLARRREFGVLRHLGMTKAQVGAMLATEGLVVSAIGLIVGLTLGFAISLILIHVVNGSRFTGEWSFRCRGSRSRALRRCWSALRC
jgi:putative ABC transport system permease protein